MQTATLTRADIEAHDPEGGRGGRWLCPMPACAEHTDPRRHRSLSLVTETGLWHCHRCHAQGQIKDAWKPFEKKSKRERDADLMTRRRVGLDKILAKLATADTDAGNTLSALDKWRYGSLVKLETSRPAMAYLATRGLSSPDALQLLTRSGVRFAPDFGRREATDTVKASSGTASIVFPLRDAKGKLIASQGRFLKPWSSGQKFHTLGDKLAGVFATAGAMEILQKGGPVAIVEAPLDAVTLALAGVPALALCGCNGLPEWLQRKAFGRQWLIAFDNDENGAGDRAADAIGGTLRSLGGIVSRLRPTEAKDWNEALQMGGEVWERTAAALQTVAVCEAKSPLSEKPAATGEPRALPQDPVQEARKGPKRPDENVTFLSLSPEPSATEPNQPGSDAMAAHAALIATWPPPLYGASDPRQELLDWVGRLPTLPVPSEPITLPSGQIAPAGDSFAQWWHDAYTRAVGLLDATGPTAREALLVLRQDLKFAAVWIAEAWEWLRLPREFEGAACLLHDSMNPELPAAKFAVGPDYPVSLVPFRLATVGPCSGTTNQEAS